jgi:hypothetical protein
MAARFKIILLDRLTPGTTTLRFVMWADVPASRWNFHTDATKTSAWRNAMPDDLAALRNGSVLERVDTLAMDGAVTNTQVRTSIQARWTAFQATVTADTTHSVYGSTWDGTTWVPAGA